MPPKHSMKQESRWLQRAWVPILIAGFALCFPLDAWGQATSSDSFLTGKLYPLAKQSTLVPPVSYVGTSFFEPTTVADSSASLLSGLNVSAQPLVPKVAPCSVFSTAKGDASEEMPDWLAAESSSDSGLDLSATIQKLVTSTTIILVVCVGAIFLIKKNGWFQRLKSKIPIEPSVIKQTIKLGRNSFLYLIQVEGAHLVVGIDGTGIKSIVKTGSSFENDLSTVSTEELNAISMALDPNAADQGKVAR